MRHKVLKIVLFVLIVGSFNGCVYFNTLFLARKNYKKAEKIRVKDGGDVVSGAAKSHYDKTIEKTLKVLTIYPESDYVDDALFLLGMSYLRTGEYSKALRKFNEILEYFPGSKYANESRYWRSVCLYYGGKEDDAVDSLEIFAKENPDRAEEALFMIAELAFKDSNFIDAKNAFLRFIESFPKSSKIPKVRLRLGQVEWFFEEYEKAANYLKPISKRDLPNIDYLEARILLAKCYIKLDKLNKADKILHVLLNDDSFRKNWSEVELIVGDVALSRKDTSSAREIWENITRRYPKTEQSAWAYMKLGDMYFDLGKLALAKEMYNSAASEFGSTEINDLAMNRISIVERFLEYRAAINSDTLGGSAASAQIKMAEMFLLELDLPDSAIAAYKSVIEKFPDDSMTPRAAYSLGWVLAYKKKEIEAADRVFAEVLEKYPESDYAVGAVDYFKSRGGALDSMSVRNVAYYFIKAEEFWLTYEWTDSALIYYSFVIDSFTGSRWVPKAMIAKAEILSLLGQGEAAKKLLQQLKDRFPKTPYDSLAQVMLGESITIELAKSSGPKNTESLTELTPGDSTDIFDPRISYEGLPEAPRPIERLKLYYPEAEWSSRLDKKIIIIKIIIDAFGRVPEVKLIRGCGNSVIDQAVLNAAKRAEFDSSKMDIELFGKWFVLKVRVKKPEVFPQQ